MKRLVIASLIFVLTACGAEPSATSINSGPQLTQPGPTSSTTISYNPTWKTKVPFDSFAAPFAQSVCDTLDVWKPPVESTTQEVREFTSLTNDLKEMIGTPSKPSYSDTYIQILAEALYALKLERTEPNSPYLPYTISERMYRVLCDDLGLTSSNSRFGVLNWDPQPTSTTTQPQLANGYRRFEINGFQIKPEVDLNRKDLKKLDLSDADLENSILIKTDFSWSNLSGANLTGARMASANFTYSKLADARIVAANGESANLTMATLSNANLLASNFTAADLTWANLTGANLEQAFLERSKLVGTNLTKANLKNAFLASADLTGANLKGANLSGADLNNVILVDVNLFGANLSRTNLEGATFGRTIMPDGKIKD